MEYVLMSRKHSGRRALARGADASTEERRAREERERQSAEDLRERHAFRRRMFDGFKLWTVCPHKICRRNRRCSGDTDECLTQRWHQLMPQDTRHVVAKAIQFMSDGMPAAQATAAAEADLKQRQEIAARMLMDANGRA